MYWAMIQVNIHEAKTHLSRLLRQVAAGQTVVIARDGVPVARLERVDAPGPGRVPGQDAGLITIRSDFDDPLPDEIGAAFRQ